MKGYVLDMKSEILYLDGLFMELGITSRSNCERVVATQIAGVTVISHESSDCYPSQNQQGRAGMK